MDEHWLLNRAQALRSEAIRYRRTLHAHPELSFHEKETASFIAEELLKIKEMKVETGVGLQTSVIGTLTGGDGPMIGLRADMDALPIQEENECSFRSRHNGVMHACGHDAHMSIALTVAKIMGELKQTGELPGKVRFIFQPAEETTDTSGKTGAQHLVQAGVLNDLDALFALHVKPDHPAGDILVPDGYCTANVDEFSASIKGKGGHGAYPHLGKDPVWMLGCVLQAIQGIVSRGVSPLEPAVVSVCHIQAGDGKTKNVIPSEVLLEGTFRSYSPEVRDQIVQDFDKTLSMVQSLGGSCTLSVNRGEPSVYNNEELTRLLRSTARILLPGARLLPEPFGLGGEDFAHMTRKVPSAMFFLGCARNDGIQRELHSPLFDIDERCLSIGVSLLADAILSLLHQPGKIPGKTSLLKKEH